MTLVKNTQHLCPLKKHSYQDNIGPRTTTLSNAASEISAVRVVEQLLGTRGNEQSTSALAHGARDATRRRWSTTCAHALTTATLRAEIATTSRAHADALFQLLRSIGAADAEVVLSNITCSL